MSVPMIHKKLSLLIGSNDVEHYDAVSIPTYFWTNRYFKWFDWQVVDTPITDGNSLLWLNVLTLP